MIARIALIATCATSSMRPGSIIALIGSHARGDTNSWSDCDVLVVGSMSTELSSTLEKKYGPTLNLVMYDWRTFRHLYRMGSLFLYHVLSEGVLLEGSAPFWSGLCDGFSVKSDFSSEIADCAACTRWFEHPCVFGGRFLTPLAFAFTQVKNVSIFFLAHHGIRIFNKSEAIRTAAQRIGFEKTEALIGLRNFYDYSLRDANLALPFAPDDAAAGASALRTAREFVRRLQHASG